VQPAPEEFSQVLTGKQVLITRSAEQSKSLAQGIREMGGTPVLFPVIEILPPDSWAAVDEALSRLATYHWLVFTSRNGVAAVGERLTALGLALTDFPDLKLAVVGTPTQAALAALGRSPDVLPLEFRGAALPAAMTPFLRRGDQLLLPRGDLADSFLPDTLRAKGIHVHELIAYRNVRPQVDTSALVADLASGRIDYATFTSSTTVVNLVELLGGAGILARTKIACIGPETKRVAESLGLRVDLVADQATSSSLVMAIARHAQNRG